MTTRPRRGRPARDPNAPTIKQVNTRVSAQTLAELDVLAAKHGMRRGEFVRGLIEKAVRREHDADPTLLVNILT